MPNVIPKPFKKDSISLAAHGKEWQTLAHDQIELGDIVRDHGLVIEREWDTRWGVVKLKFQSGEVLPSKQPYPEYVVFTRKR